MKPTKALVVLSGGQDSTTCLFWAKQAFDEVYAVTYDYGQRHKRELDAAKKVVSMAGVIEHEIVVVGSILQSASPLVSNNKLEQYDNFNVLPGGLEKTFVPGRNLLFATLAANHAYARGITDVVMGVCEEDYGGYPDCRQVFINATREAIRLGFADSAADGFEDFMIHTPLMYLSKADSIRLALNFPGCFDALAWTHTAYDGAYPPIGHDHATLLRAKGFFEANVPDPLVVRAYQEGLIELPETSNYDAVRS